MLAHWKQPWFQLLEFSASPCLPRICLKGLESEDRGHVQGTVLALPPVTHTGAFDLIKEK